MLIALSTSLSAQLEISKINDSVLVYTTYQPIGEEFFPSNSMCVLTNSGILMVDTPWDTTQLRPLFDSLQKFWQARPVQVISTHFHKDRTAGLDWLSAHGVKTISIEMTRQLCMENNEEIPQFVVEPGSYVLDNVSYTIVYPGPGHAPDNIVLYFPRWKLLYGGCFIKSFVSENLGNVGDADVRSWLKAAKHVRKQYGSAELVITGHQDWKGLESLNQTIHLLHQAKKSGQ